TLLGHAAHERTAREAAEQAATAQASSLAQRAAAQARATVQAADELERARRRVAELKQQETRGRAIRRQTEEALAQLTARRDALAELERERVGLAPAAQALLKDRGQFGDAVVGPLADFVRASHRDAALAERLLGGWRHAVLVRDAAGRAAAALDRTLAELAAAEAAFNVAGEAAERTRQQELEAGGLKGEAERAAAHARREAADAAAEVGRLSRRLEEVEERLATLG